MAGLVGTVWVKDEAQQPVSFGPADEQVPDWALEQMGDHCFEDGKRPAKPAAKRASSAKK